MSPVTGPLWVFPIIQTLLFVQGSLNLETCMQNTLTWLTIWRWFSLSSICSNIINKHKCEKSQCHHDRKNFEYGDFDDTIWYGIVKWKASWSYCSLPDSINFTIAKNIDSDHWNITVSAHLYFFMVQITCWISVLNIWFEFSALSNSS